jgi:pyruvate dehydrogenase E1 component beta subunit
MRQITYAQAIKEAMQEELRMDSSVLLLGEGVSTGGAYKATKGLCDEFGEERILDVPSSFNAITGTALGLAMTGAKPIAEIKGDFLLRCMDTIANQIAPTEDMLAAQFGSALVIRADIGYAPELGAQQAQSYESMFCQIPGLTVVYPSNAADAKGLLKTCIQATFPVLFLENKALYAKKEEVPEETEYLEISKAAVKREGTDLTVISYGVGVSACLDAAERAVTEEISCEVIDLRTIYPFDQKTVITSVMKTGKVLIVHEAHKIGGVGAEIAACIAESEAFDYLECPITRLAAKDIPIPYDETTYKTVVPNADIIYDKILELTC